MIDWLKVAIEIGILAFFALLYYFFQSRKLTRFHNNETANQFALWIYDYHHYLDSIKDHPHYLALNSFVTDIEEINLKNNAERIQLIEKIPTQMPLDFRERLQKILEL